MERAAVPSGNKSLPGAGDDIVKPDGQTWQFKPADVMWYMRHSIRVVQATRAKRLPGEI